MCDAPDDARALFEGIKPRIGKATGGVPARGATDRCKAGREGYGPCRPSADCLEGGE
jgi:hypothetical protein